MEKTKITIIFTAVAILLALTDFSIGFSFNGETVPCNGTNVTGYPKIKEQYQRCNKSTHEDFLKRNITPEGFAPLLCTGLCGFIEDKLVDKKTGLLIKSGLDSYHSMFEHIPEKVRKEIKATFYNCFEEHKNDTVYNVEDPHDCSGITGVAICIKFGIDGVCNPTEEESEE